MASTYVNDLRLNEMATGDGSGTWGTTTNTNLELIAEAFSYGTEVITTNADTHTTTIADGATDPGRSLYLKYTGTLDSACTITIGPNTVSKVWIIENGTSGSQNIIISQGSGANITIPAGDTKVVYSDGAGAGAAFFDAFASLSVVDLKVQDDLTVTDDVIIGGDIDLEGAIDVNGTANLDVVDIDGAVDMASTLQVDGVATFTGRDIHSGGITIANAGQIGSVGDTDAIAIASDGVVTLTQKLVGTELDISGNVDVDGTTETDVLTINGSQFNYKAFGTDSIMIGDTTTGTIDAADRNVGLGVDVFEALTTGDDNTGVGKGALNANTTGNNNTGVGRAALGNSTTASNNTAVGYLALLANTEGTNLVAVGANALDANTTANNNTAVGNSALTDNTTGASNIAVGKNALANNTTAANNVAIGTDVMETNTTGADNTAVGTNALQANTTASGNTAVGYNCMDANTTGNESAAFGYGALGAHTTGNSNTALGYFAGQNLTNGGNNTFVGRSSGATYSAGTRSVAIGSFAAGGAGDKTGDSNVSIGYIAGAALTSGANNVFIGDTAGNADTTGGGNTVIGQGAGASITTGNNNLCIGKGTDVDTGAATSRLGLGVALSLTGADQIKIGIASDFIVNTFISNATWSHSSDERLKKNITDDSLGLTFINKLRPVTYNWKPFEEQPEDIRGTASNKKDDRKYHGMIAQEVKQSLDDVGVNTFTGWTENEEGVQMISEQMFVYPLIKAVQELSTQVDELKSELLALKGE
jgi:trimeric autotransporter adhesin